MNSKTLQRLLHGNLDIQSLRNVFGRLQRIAGCVREHFGPKAMTCVCSETHIARTTCCVANTLIIKSACFRRTWGNELLSQNDQVISFVYVGNWSGRFMLGKSVFAGRPRSNVRQWHLWSLLLSTPEQCQIRHWSVWFRCAWSSISFKILILELVTSFIALSSLYRENMLTAYYNSRQRRREHPSVLLVMPQEKYGFAQQMLVFVGMSGRILLSERNFGFSLCIEITVDWPLLCFCCASSHALNEI